MEEKKQFQFDLKSEPMNEMLGSPPSWMVRSGSASILLIILLLLGISYIIQYSNEIKGEVTVSTSQPPIELVNQAFAQVVAVHVQNEQKVTKGQLLVQFDNKANNQDIALAKTYLETLSIEKSKVISAYDQTLNLGSFQETWIALQLKIEEWNAIIENKTYQEQVNTIQRELGFRQKLQGISAKKMKLTETEYTMIAEDLATSKKLLENNAISKQALNQEKRVETQALQSVQAQKEQFVQNSIQMNALRNQLFTLKLEQNNRATTLQAEMEQAVANLKNQIYEWVKNITWSAPCDGKVVFNKMLQTNKFYKASEASIIVLPVGSSYVGYAKIKAAGTGKVKKGQAVFIALEDFPKNEFGMLEGRVASITSIEKDGMYEVKIVLQNGLLSTYKKIIPFKAQLKGQVKIITKKRRLLERFFEKLTDLVSK